MNLLVTGGSGFIGSHFVRSAIDRGHSVKNIDCLTYASLGETLSDLNSQNYSFSQIDVSNFEELNRIDFSEFDYIVHFAAESHVDRSISSPRNFIDTNIIGTFNVLEKLKSSPRSKMLYISTDEIYGSIDHGSWDESCPIEPRSPYSASKASGELLCNSYRITFGLDIVITRTCNNFGPYQNPEKLIPKTIINALQNRTIPVYGDGLNKREWIFVKDNIEAIFQIISAKSIKNHIYNIGGYEIDNISLVHKILGLMSASKDLIKFVKDRLGHDFRYSLDDSLFQKEFNKIYFNEFEANLRETVVWYGHNMDWVNKISEKVK